ncbi:TetR/AcrR family transcriptional regulator [Aeromicrobium alkaliterrae]|uniref:TetR/AcrR family transcriptional regulator n=1 Tax=Aeromicrobium alkaliterrae TaxID=302168 RepID=A0ABP4WA09_9ACTN
MAQSNPPARRPRRDLMESEIVAGAAKVFDEKGIGTSTLQDVADHLGIGRPSLYHYFPSKQALLQRLINDLITSTEAALEKAVIPDGQDASAAERLRHVLAALLAPIAEFPSRFRILMSPEATPDEETVARVAATRRVFRDAVQSIIADGVRDGEFRAVDPRIATYMALGSINWVAWWYHADMGIGPDELADGLVELVLMGVALPERDPASVSELHRRITSDVARLGSMLDGA